ncbi:MAG: class I SAM-dependent methyltransferase [Prolixibacteraceae bacterium]
MRNTFDERAASWDENPRRLKLVENVWEVLKKQLKLSGIKNVLDYGCGTGLLGYKLIDQVKSITFCDTSQAMLEQVEKKREYYGYQNVNTLCSDFSQNPVRDEKYDLILSMLVLHHVENLDSVLSNFKELLSDDGQFCWIDIDLEDGSFHDDNTGIHHFGFSKAALESHLKNNGFDLNFYTNELVVVKEREGVTEEYPLFVMVAEKCK